MIKEKVIDIIVEQLGVEEDEVKSETFMDDLGADALGSNQSQAAPDEIRYRAMDGLTVQPLDELSAAQDPVRWGILGCGCIANDFVLALQKVPNAVVQAVAARDANRARQFAQKHGVETWYGDYRQLVEDPKVDVVYVATISRLHREHAELVLRAGKHALVEKPLATTPEDAAAIQDTAAASGKFCMEAMWMRFFPAVEFARRAIREGQIGRVRHVRSDFGFNLIADEGIENSKWAAGAGMNVGVYPAHTAVMVLGGHVLQQSAIGSLDDLGYSMDVEGALYVRFRDDQTALVTWSHLVETAAEADIIGTQGTIRLETPAYAPTRVTITRKSGPRRDDEAIVTTHEFPLPVIDGEFFYPSSEGLYYEAAAVQRCIAAGLTESPQAPLSESVCVIEMIHRAVDNILTRQEADHSI